MLARLMGSSDLVTTCICWLGAGRLKVTMMPTSTSILARTDLTPSHPGLALKPVNSVSAHMCLVFYKLPPYTGAQSKCICYRASLCVATQGEHLGLPSPPSHSDKIPAGFHSQILWELLFLALVPWAGCGAEIPHSSVGTSTAEISL